MRLLISTSLLALALASPAGATPPPCVTEESRQRAWAAAAPYLSPPYFDLNSIEVGDEFLMFRVECEAHADHRTTCNLDSIPNSPVRLRDAAHAYYRELEFCRSVPAGPLGEIFAVGVKADPTPAPSP